jgi:hypothetical protein
MGANVYLKAVTSKGYLTAASAVAIVHNIAGVGGGRVAILAYGASCGVAENLIFMQVLGTTTLSAAATSGTTTCVFVGDPGPVGNLQASGDMVAIVLADGTYHFATLTNWWVSNYTAVLTALTGSALAGAAVYNFGIQTDTGHIPHLLTANTQTTKSQDPGVIFGNGKGYPMKVYHPNTGSQPKSIDYVTVQFINV